MKITKRLAKEIHNEKGKSFDEGVAKGRAELHEEVEAELEKLHDRIIEKCSEDEDVMNCWDIEKELNRFGRVLQNLKDSCKNFQRMLKEGGEMNYTSEMITGIYNQGRAECLAKVEKIIDEDIKWYKEWSEDKNEKDATIKLQVGALLSHSLELKERLQRLKDNSPSNVVGKPMTPSATQTSGNVTAVRTDTRKGIKIIDVKVVDDNLVNELLKKKLREEKT